MSSLDWPVLAEEMSRGTARDPLQHFRPRTKRECPLCGFTGYFLSAGPRQEARCPNCASKERDFDGRAGYRSNHYPTLPVSLPENARNLQIERAVVRMPMQHRTMVTMYYAERRAPVPICRAVAVPWRDFGRWMFDCRAMVLNLLRFQDA